MRPVGAGVADADFAELRHARGGGGRLHGVLHLGHLEVHLRGPRRREHLHAARAGLLLVGSDPGLGAAGVGEVFGVVADAALPAEIPRVRVEGDAVLARHANADVQVFVGVGGVEVEDEDERSSLGDDEFALLARGGHPLVLVREELVALVEVHHRPVEVVELVVAEVLGVGEVPAAAAVVVRPLVALAGEVDPLGVAELVTHEVQVPLAADGHGDEAKHLVQRHPAVHHRRRLLERAHAVVHLGVHEPEGVRLGPDDGLIVGLGVPDALLRVPTVAQRGDDIVHAPVLVPQVSLPGRLEQPDPDVRDGHRETSVEADAALAHGAAQRGHPRHVLRNHLDARIRLVQHVVRHHQVVDRGDVGVETEVLVVIPGELHLEAVVVVQHGGDAVEAEPVESVLVHPVPEVREEVPLHLPVFVVVQAAVPQPVVPRLALAEVRVLRRLTEVEARNAVLHVARHVRVNHVQEDANSHPVRGVHEVLEILGVPAPRRHRERAGDVVPERSVVRVLHHRHELHGVVAQILDAGQDVVGELSVGVHLRLETGHADVGLVDAAGGGLLRARVLTGVALVLRGVPVDAVVVCAHHAGFGVGHLDPRGDAIDPRAVALLHADLDAGAVLDGAGGEGDGPDAVLVLLEVGGVGVPAVEIADEDGAARGGGPLAEDDLARGGLVEAELGVALGELGEGALGVGDGRLALLELLPAVLEVTLVLPELLIELGAAHAVGGVAVGAGGDRAGSHRGRDGASVRPGRDAQGVTGLRDPSLDDASARSARAGGRRDGDGGRDRGGNGHFT